MGKPSRGEVTTVVSALSDWIYPQGLVEGNYQHSVHIVPWAISLLIMSDLLIVTMCLAIKLRTADLSGK